MSFSVISENCIRDSCLSVSIEGQKVRIVWSKSLRKGGFESVYSSSDSNCRVDDSCRFDSSISRTKSLIRQYSACNDWDYFCTFTINPALWDSFDLHDFYKSFGQYIQNVNKRRTDGFKLLYMLIPEQHKSGAWHFHGLMVNIPQDQLTINNNGYLDWVNLRDKFGFCSLSPIRDHEAISLYVQKYITKETLKTELPKGARFILASHGLKKAKVHRRYWGLAFNAVKSNLGEFDYKNDNCAILTCPLESLSDIDKVLDSLFLE